METYFNAQRREASALATEQVQLLESIGDPTLTLALLTAAISVKHETAEMHEVLRLAQYAIDLAGGDATKGGKIATSSPLALAMSFRGLARWCLGITGWRNDFEQAVQMVKTAEAVTRGGVLYYTHTMSMLHGVLGPNDAILHEMTEILSSAEQTGEDVAFGLAQVQCCLRPVTSGWRVTRIRVGTAATDSRYCHAAAVLQNRDPDDRCLRGAGSGVAR